tara:strand:- start:5604 stop:5918 length:315 start_codon:yes stop_codon:yes gene_type:complete
MNNIKKEFINKQNNDNGWKISHKYSTILLNNLNKITLEKTFVIYGSFISELKTHDLYIRNKKYLTCWETMINTYKNIFKKQFFDKSKVNFCIKQLHYNTILHTN